ncbi:MAG: sel1 repeat family protein [Acidobacteria bacterium]|nr:sel1 repeat family protein [Acidobacteriota bacterium]
MDLIHEYRVHRALSLDHRASLGRLWKITWNDLREANVATFWMWGMSELGKRQTELQSTRVGGNNVKQLALSLIAWSLLSPVSFGQKEYPELDEMIEQSAEALDKAGEAWLAALERSAEDGHVEAQAELGRVYYQGYIFVNNRAMKVPKDYSRALKLCQQAAELGHGTAQYGLGKMYYYGMGVPRNYTEAFKWYLKSAMRGVWIAQGELGFMYSNGRGVLQDFVKAYAWLNLAASRGDMGDTWLEAAVSERDRVREEMTPAQVAKAQKLVAELFNRIESSKSE